jgi:transposase-like protein
METRLKLTPFQQTFSVVQDVQTQIREVLETQMRGSVLGMVQELFKEEVEKLCGKKHSRKFEDQCHRRGSDDGSVIVKGQRIKVKKLRVRRGDEEITLQSYSALQDFDLLCENVMKHMVNGVATRRYEPLLEEISQSTGLKRSSVSKAFVKGSKESLEEINSRDLSKLDIAVIMIDGIGFGDRTVVAAKAITTKGKKHIIGLVEGDTENSEVVKDLLTKLIERGLCTTRVMLFVVDGAKALKKGILSVFGDRAVIQRCVRHKERNIISYLSKDYHKEFRRRWKKLHGCADYSIAKREYDELVHWLGHINHAALESLEEAEMETLTVIKLKVPGLLKKTLLSTNPLESAFSNVSRIKQRVKNWKSGANQVSRWAAVSLLEAEKSFRTIRGYQQMPLLMAELEKLSIENKSAVA